MAQFGGWWRRFMDPLAHGDRMRSPCANAIRCSHTAAQLVTLWERFFAAETPRRRGLVVMTDPLSPRCRRRNRAAVWLFLKMVCHDARHGARLPRGNVCLSCRARHARTISSGIVCTIRATVRRDKLHCPVPRARWIRRAPRPEPSGTAPWILKAPQGGSEVGCR